MLRFRQWSLDTKLLAGCLFVTCLAGLYSFKAVGGIQQFLINYSYGFGDRKLLSSLFRLLIPQGKWFIPICTGIMIFFHVSLTAMFVWISAITYNSVKNKRSLLLYWGITWIVYFFSYYSFRGYQIEFASLHSDIMLAVNMLLFFSLFLLKQDKGVCYYVLVTILLVSSCLYHSIFCCLYFPFYLAIFVYDSCIPRVDYRKICGYIGSCLLLLVSFVLLWKMSVMTVDFEVLSHIMDNDSNGYFWPRTMVFYQYYGSLSQHLHAYMLPFWKYHLIRFILTVMVMLPLLILLALPWSKAVRLCKEPSRRIAYFMMMCCPLLMMPAFILGSDYGRWFYAFFFSQFMLLSLMILLNDHYMTDAMEQCVLSYKKKKKMLAVALIWILIFTVDFRTASGNVSPAPVDWVCTHFNLFDGQYRTEQFLPKN